MKWVGYLYDCQHKYCPDFFSDDDSKIRDEYFSDMLNNAKALIVNSWEVKKDLTKFFAVNENKIFNLPVAPILRIEYLKNIHDIKIKYNLPEKYFLISNQFWIHKSHITAFEALKLLNEQFDKNVCIVCTGEMNDPRFPAYINNLKQKIKGLGIENKLFFLGYIDKRDQIEIMKNAIAVIQPTLFEGGPGGGSVQDAVAIGVRAIVSDIPINWELPQDENITYFKTKSSKDLAAKMKLLLRTNYTRPSDIILINKYNKRIEKLSAKLDEVIEHVLN